MPFDRNLICLPDWLPDGTLTLLLPPSKVGTSISPPSAARAMETGTLQNKL